MTISAPLAVIAVGAPGTIPSFAADPAITVVENVEGKSLAAIGNEWLDRMDCEVFGLCHFDVTFGTSALDSFYQCAAAGSVCGIVGVDDRRVYRWSHLPTDFSDADAEGFVRGGPGEVSTLDSCAVFFRKNLGLRFDEETFDSFHCHVEDLCLQAQTLGISVEVPTAVADHHGVTTTDPEWQSAYWKYRERLAAKWRGVRFSTT